MNDEAFFASILAAHPGSDVPVDLVPRDPRMLPLDAARQAGEDVEFDEGDEPRGLFCSPGTLVIETTCGDILEVQVEEQSWVGHWPRRVLTRTTCRGVMAAW
jgi:hypothetical protein